MITGKKILIITTTDNMIWQFMLGHIRHLRDAGNTVECACAETGFWFNELVEKHGLTVHKINFARTPFKPKNFSAYKHLKQIVRDGNFDLIRCHQPVGGVMGRLAAKSCGVPVIYIAHGFHFYRGAPLKLKMYKYIERHFSKNIDAIGVYNAEDYAAAQKFKAKRKYLMLGSGYDPTKNTDYPFDADALRNEIGIAPDDYIVLNIGECIKRKNQKMLIQMFRNIDNEKIKLVICGGGQLLDKYRKLVKKLGLENRVKMLGYRKDVRNILKISDVLVFPTFQEGLPMSVMEAMHQGIPIIASNIRGTNDLINDGVNGILVSVSDKSGYIAAIKKLHENPELAKQFATQSQHDVQKRYIGEVLKQYEKIYHDVLG